MTIRTVPFRPVPFRPASLAACAAAALMLSLAPAAAQSYGHRAAPPQAAAKGAYAAPARHQVERRHRAERHPSLRERRYRSPIVHHHVIHVPPRRVRHYRRIVVVRPWGHWYRGYGFYRRDADAWRWLAFTAITVRLVDFMSESQQRTYEAAQVRATAAPLGQPVRWHSGTAHGAVTALAEGTSAHGHYCREFQHTVTIGGRSERAYGTACRQPDGAWQVVSSGQ